MRCDPLGSHRLLDELGSILSAMYQGCQWNCPGPAGGSDESWKLGAHDTLTHLPENTFRETVPPPTTVVFHPSWALPSLYLPGVETWQVLGTACPLSLA